jgi:phenylalanyl-tRNA synthetase beta chain
VRFWFCAVLTGAVAPPSLVDPAPRPAVFADLVALTELLGRGEWEFVAAPHQGFKADASYSLVAGGAVLGCAGALAEVDGPPVFCLEVDLSALSALGGVRRTVRMPADREPLTFNVTVVVPESTPAAAVRALVADAAQLPLWRVGVQDLFQGDRVGPGRLALTLRAGFPGIPGEAVRPQRRRRREAVLRAIAEHGWEGR